LFAWQDVRSDQGKSEKGKGKGSGNGQIEAFRHDNRVDDGIQQPRVSASAAAGMTAAAAQFRHVLGFLTVLGAVLTELPVGLDRT
jgi:hypothetical protein